jgi:hypothetical protein
MSKSKPLSYHVTKFSDKVRVMNDSSSKSVTLTADEARNLHTDIFALLAKIAELSVPPAESAVTTVLQDGGGFK